LTPTRPAWGPRPTHHVTGAPVATCKKLRRHSRHYRASSTAELVPRLEATLCMTQQCQPGTSVTGQSAAGEGATVDTARNGPVVMAVAGRRKQRSSRQLSHPVLEGKPNANHVRARISNSRTHQLHNMDIITQCSNSIKREIVDYIICLRHPYSLYNKSKCGKET
jgi:hypothetical protein